MVPYSSSIRIFESTKFWVNTLYNGEFPSDGSLVDLRTLRRAAFSSSFKSLAIMNRQLVRHLLKLRIKTGWQFLEFNLEQDSHSHDPNKLDQLQMEKVGSSSRARNESASSNKNSLSPKGLRFGEAVEQ
ncbi:hypothetical protein Tco_0226738 [Tanacetum coccineum]